MIFRDKINKVDAWMSYRQLPGSLRSDITGYYANSCSPLLPSLPSCVRALLPYLRSGVCYRT